MPKPIRGIQAENSGTARPALTDPRVSAGPSLLLNEDFVWGELWPAIAEKVGDGNTRPSRFELKVLRDHVSGSRQVAEYRFDGSIRVIAKRYGTAEDAQAAARIL